MHRPVISIIIPVYQSAPYLPRCLDNILRQSFTDWELLLVDDGSTDGSGELCVEYASSSEKIHDFHQKNAGISAARNTGLNHMRGEYVAMVDSDDILLDRDYLLLLYNAAVQTRAEVSMCGHINFPCEGPLPAASGSGSVLFTLCGEDAFVESVFPNHFFLDASHGKLFHRRLFRDVRYPVGRNMEDYSIMHKIFFPCKRVAVVDRIMYGHRMHSSSVIHSTPPVSLSQDFVFGLQERIDYFNSLGRPDLAYLSEQKLLRGIMNQKVLRALNNKKKEHSK